MFYYDCGKLKVWDLRTSDFNKFSPRRYERSGVQSSPSISLPPFGCATYKFQGDIWFNHGHSDYGRLSHLNKAAESWIRQLGFEHHDFNFFTRQTGHHLVVSPYKRIPLFDTVKNLSKSNPGLQTLTSIDLTPSSWMCVASWYPVCHIPNIGIPFKDFEAAFLTFHSISSFYQDFTEEDVQMGCNKRSPSISLPPLGCVTYKVEGNIWLNHGDLDFGRLYHLNKSADLWINQLGFEHHDFRFFTRQCSHHLVSAEPNAEPSPENTFHRFLRSIPCTGRQLNDVMLQKKLLYFIRRTTAWSCFFNSCFKK
ncbi:hypothetical protein DCAR_0416111 [Daucus carota subsp. sativus]|uniref:Uncharacterized protein n=1 Tax=Daucus carota subsp. sativus TaxID=79200 RepID=A0A165X6C4_DAUCS|nr:hypothetical protein DCAR_0416111 [Daucus carota subsp. sativus]